MPKTLIETGVGALAVRFLNARRLRAFTTSAGVALGVGLIAAITIMGSTLRAALVDQQRAGFGTYDLQVIAKGGLLSLGDLQPALVELVRAGQVRSQSGVLLITPGSPESRETPTTTDYLGVGPTPKGESVYALKEGRYPGPAEFVARPAVVERLGLKIGESISLPFKSGEQKVTLTGIRMAVGGDLGEAPNAFTFDLSWLQSQMGHTDSFNSLLVWSESKQLVAQAIGLRVPEVLPVIRSETDAAESGISLVSTWAIVLGLMAFFAAFFMVAGTFHIAIHERLHELSILRAIGSTPEQVMRLVLQEAAVLGTLGSLGGLLAGAGASHLSLAMASASFGVESRPLVFPVLLLAAEGIGGVLLALAAAWGPARAAGRLRPLEAMRPARQPHLQQDTTQLLPGGLLMTLSALLIPSGFLLPGGGGLRVLVSTVGGLSFVIGLVLLLPGVLPKIMVLLAAPLQRLFPVETLIAARSAVRHRRRSAMTLTTLLVGVLLLSSVGTVLVEVTGNGEESLRRLIPADAMVTAGGISDLGTALAEQIAALPGVSLTVPVTKGLLGIMAYWDWSKADQAWLQQMEEREAKREVSPTAHKQVNVVGTDLNLYAQIIDPGEIQGDPSQGATLTVEAARHRGIKMGDTLSFVTAAQSAEAKQGKEVTPTLLVVTALVESWPDSPYGFAEDTIVVPRSMLPTPDRTVYFNYDQNRQTETMTALRHLLDNPQFGLAELRIFADELAESRRQGRQIWSILASVAVVIFIVATISLVNVIIAGIQARRRELATIRAVGSTPVQTARQVVLEAVLMGLTGSLLGLLAAAVFTTAASIGLDAALPPNAPWLYLGCLLGGPLIGATAALLPARSISRGPVSEVLRAE